MVFKLIYKILRYPYWQFKKYYIENRDRKLRKPAKKYSPQINKKQKTIEKINIFRLTKKYRSPLFITSKPHLIKKYQLLRKTLNQYYLNSSIAYSIKTNNVYGICQVFKNQGALAEVVSAYEYFLAKKLDYKDKNIIYNGPYKNILSLKKALKNKAKIHVDNFEELKTVCRLSQDWKQKTPIGIRVNTFKNNTNSRFGFNIEKGKAQKAISIINKNSKLVLTGIHCHIGSNIKKPEVYFKTSQAICSWISKLKLKTLKYLDLGGGFPVCDTQIIIYSFFKKSVLEIKDFIKAIIDPIKCYNLQHLKLILEPGRFLVDEAVVLATTVLHTRLDNQKQLITTDGSTSIFPLAQFQNKKAVLIPKSKNQSKKNYQSIIYGASCMETDCLTKDQKLPPIFPGDIILFEKVGAYNISQANQFIFPRPAVIMIDGKKIKILRKAEKNKGS